MKNIILISCFLFALSSCGNNAKKEHVIQANNYLYYGGVENKPHSKPIKKQVSWGSEHKVIDFNTNGLITSVETDSIKLDINYELAKALFIENGEVMFDFDVEFDPSFNIIKQQDLNKNTSWISTFDDQGRIIKIDRLTVIEPVTIVNSTMVVYEDDTVKTVSNKTTYDKDDQQFLMSKEDRFYFYNTNNQVKKMIIDSQQYDAFAKNKENYLLAQNITECFFYDYNKNGDWTKYYCLVPEQETTHFVLRELTY